jgi:hypothetical protein
MWWSSVFTNSREGSIIGAKDEDRAVVWRPVPRGLMVRLECSVLVNRIFGDSIEGRRVLQADFSIEKTPPSFCQDSLRPWQKS